MSNAFEDFQNRYAGRTTVYDSMTEAQVSTLVGVYDTSILRIQAKLNAARKDVNYSTAIKQLTLLKQISAEIQKLDNSTSEALSKATAFASEWGTTHAIKDLAVLGVGITKAESWHYAFNNGYAEQMAKDSFMHVAAQTDKMEAGIKTMLRQETALVMQRAAVEGITRKAATKLLMGEMLAKEPDFKFIDSAGKRWKTRTYFEMLGRTLMHNAERGAYVNSLTAEGQDLVRFSSHGAPDLCRKWEGRVISLTGATPGYPTLAEAIGSGEVFHPRCKHRLVAYHKDIDDVFEALDAGESADEMLASKSKEVAATKAEKKAIADEEAFLHAMQEKLDSGESVTFEKGHDYSTLSLNGVPFKSVADFISPSDFKDVPDSKSFTEPAVKMIAGKTLSTGVLIREADGRIWVYEPTGHYGGYENTYAKGGVKNGLTMQQGAMIEALEELGLNVKIKSWFGDYEKSSTLTRYYIAERVGGSPADAHWESDKVKLLTPKDAMKALNTEVDKTILKDFLKQAENPTGSSNTATPLKVEPKPQAGKIAQTIPENEVWERSNFEQIGPQGGSNEGGIYRSKATGEKYYIKLPQSELHIKNEIATANLYKLTDVDVPNLVRMDWDGRGAVVSQWREGYKPNLGLKNVLKQFHTGFATDAWLANWDVAGLTFDNIKMSMSGTAFRLDVGGGLLMRAQGTLKGTAFGEKVSEIDTMRFSTTLAPQASQVFGGIIDSTLLKSMKTVAKLPAFKIRDALQDAGFDTWNGDGRELYKLLLSRRDDIGAQIKNLEEQMMVKKMGKKSGGISELQGSGKVGWWNDEPTKADLSIVREHWNYGEYESSSYVAMLVAKVGKGGKGLTREEATAIVAYTNGSYENLNRILREEGHNAGKRDWIGAYARVAHSGLRKIAAQDGYYKGSVRRGISIDSEDLEGFEKQWPVGQETQRFDFLSTAIGNRGFGGNVCIYIKDSKTGVDIKQYSAMGDGEAEVLFAPGAKYHVDDVKHNHHDKGRGETYKIAVFLTEI